MFNFIEGSIRGGISTISTRYAKANNKNLSDYDDAKISSYILPLDANNLYGHSMSQKLPSHNFSFLTQDEIDNFNIDNVDVEGDIGYICEVDLTYPIHLHDSHRDYPLAPEHMTVLEDMLSPYCKEVLSINNHNHFPSKKLIPNLYNKRNYVTHIKNLKYYTSQGLKITKIHNILQFNQSAWMADYIDFNTSMRALATDSFTKDFYKLANNAVFGRTMMDPRKFIELYLATSAKYFQKLVRKPTYKSHSIINENLVAVEMARVKIKLMQPLYVGFTVLELSKLLMYQFHYDYILPNYNQNAKLLFTDTDSLVYDIRTCDIYDDMLQDLHRFDTSEYPVDHKLYSEKNKKVIGKFKDESFGQTPSEFVGLRAKMYSFLEGKRTAKGIKKSVVYDRLTHEMYKNCLISKVSTNESFNIISSKNHNVFSICKNKLGLSAFDDKRFILNDGINTLPYGHYKIPDYIKLYGEKNENNVDDTGDDSEIDNDDVDDDYDSENEREIMYGNAKKKIKLH